MDGTTILGADVIIVENMDTGINCTKHHLRKKDTTIRCYTCTELSHIAKKCMNIGKFEDDKKDRVDNTRKQMRQQSIPKSTKETSSNHRSEVTQEVGDSIISN